MPKVRKSLYDPGYVSIIDALIERRKMLGLAQWDLAVAIGADQSWISKIERKERRLDAFELVRFCYALSVDPGDILRPVLTALSESRDGKK